MQSDLSEDSKSFLASVEHYCKGLAVSPGVAIPSCLDCCDNHGIDPEEWEEDKDQPDDEGGFSWQQCDSCGSRLGGNRYAAHGINKEGGIIHLDVCSDCLCFHANGDIPEQWR